MTETLLPWNKSTAERGGAHVEELGCPGFEPTLPRFETETPAWFETPPPLPAAMPPPDTGK